MSTRAGTAAARADKFLLSQGKRLSQKVSTTVDTPSGLAEMPQSQLKVTCWAVASITHRGAKETESPLVRADAENWIVNAAISSCVLLAFAGIFVLYALELDALAPYLDPVVVFIIVLVSIGVPVRMAWNALMALLNRAPPKETVDRVTAVVDACLADSPVAERFIRVIQPGRHRMVLVHVVLESDYRPSGLSELDAIRERTYQALSKEHRGVVLDILFTGDRKWGAPLSEGGSGG